MKDIIKRTMEAADIRVINSVADKMVLKGMDFETAFNKTIKTLRKGMIESRKKKIKLQAEIECKNHCELLGVEFK